MSPWEWDRVYRERASSTATMYNDVESIAYNAESIAKDAESCAIANIPESEIRIKKVNNRVEKLRSIVVAEKLRLMAVKLMPLFENVENEEKIEGGEELIKTIKDENLIKLSCNKGLIFFIKHNLESINWYRIEYFQVETEFEYYWMSWLKTIFELPKFPLKYGEKVMWKVTRPIFKQTNKRKEGT